MALGDGKKADNLVLQQYILECLRLLEIHPQHISFYKQLMTHSMITLYTNSKNITGVTIDRRAYQGGALSPLPLCIVLHPLTALLNKSAYEHRVKGSTPINHLFRATWKKPDEPADWYEKPLHGTWHKSVSEVADMFFTY